jgi:CPA1 family monovalent cation:H+ antiporter
MDTITIVSILIIICAIFSYINQRFIKLPGTIGVMTISMLMSVIILILGKIRNREAGFITSLATNIDFSKLLLDVMLGFLLFASALHFDYQKLKETRRAVIILSTISVLISTAVFGSILYGATIAFHWDLPPIYCFIFGALISPTDPIAVAAILKGSKISPRLETIIAGESLFNDAVGLIAFVTLLHITNRETPAVNWGDTLRLFNEEVVGGILLGGIMGYVGYRLIRSIRDYQTIFLISLSLVLGISLIAAKIHASIPLSVVSAGLLIGNKNFGSDHPALKFLNDVWKLLDDVLNTILFVMIGLQLVLLPFLKNYWTMGLLSIGAILMARMVSALLPAIVLLRKINFGIFTILTWAGLRGGVSVAMALSLPPSPYREVILSSCYFIVVFSVIVQGLTLNKIIQRVHQ